MATVSGASILWNSLSKSSPRAFQWLMARSLSRHWDWPIISSKVRKPSAAMISPLLGHEEEVVDGVLGLALELGTQHRVLRGHPHRTRVEVALAHHDAAER